MSRPLLLALWCVLWCVLCGVMPLIAADAPREVVVVSWNVLADASERERRLPV